MTSLPKKLKIKVLKEDFIGARYLNPRNCPIARAVVRDLCIAPDNSLFGVGTYSIRFLDRAEDVVWYALDSEISNLVRQMCGTKPLVKPRNLNVTLTLRQYDR
jgi:hypothetical protein